MIPERVFKVQLTISPPGCGVSRANHKCQPRQVMPCWDAELDPLQHDLIPAHLLQRDSHERPLSLSLSQTTRQV